MVAIAGPESSYNPRAAGDHLNIFPPGLRPGYEPYSCDGFCSFGLWQIFQPAHHAKLQAATGSTDPCRWRDYLFVPINNAYIAHQVWQEQGFGAWTAYNTGAYRRFLAEAELAVDAALGPPVPVVVPLPPAVAPPWQAVEPPWQSVEPPPSL